MPDIPASERGPLALLRLDLLQPQQLQSAQPQDASARLKGLTTRPTVQPSTREAPPPKTPDPNRKRPGSDKRRQNAHLVGQREVVVPLPNPPPDATRKGYEDFSVPGLVFGARTTRYRRERWQWPDGRTWRAPLPSDVAPGRHFGPALRAFVLRQYHSQRVTQPLLLAQLRQVGLDISAGQLSRPLTEGREPFHQEKAELLPAGLAVSP